MFEIFLITLIGLAFYGLITLCIKIFSAIASENGESQSRQPSSSTRDLGDDVFGSACLLNYMLNQGEITPHAYHRLRRFLQEKFPGVDLPTSADRSEPKSPRESEDTPVELVEPSVVAEAIVIREAPAAPAASRPSTHSESPPLESEPRAVPVQPAPPELTPVLDQQRGLAAQLAADGVALGDVKTLEPWDVPDSLPQPPKRKFSDVMASFMQERNIRWGELASGILIVGSAAGLVVSLRNELTRTIPYFPALLFMLITAAINGAGIYTLRKWKLRKTSRGTLLIGLLLVPLNWLAACVISGGAELRRPINDPLYWIAIVIGIAAFLAITWWSSRYLFRRGNEGLTAGVMLAGIWTLVINRFSIPSDSSFLAICFTAPLALAFMFGSGLLSGRFHGKSWWGPRTLNRLYMMFGISSFAMFSAATLILVRSSDWINATIALSPLIAFWSMAMVWVGSHAVHGVSEQDNTRRLVAWALCVLGLILAAGLFCFSSRNPTVALATCLATAGPALWIAIRQRVAWVMAVAWVSLGLAILAGGSLVWGEIELDTRVSWKQLIDTWICGQSGLGLLVLGALALGASFSSALQPPKSRIGASAGPAEFWVNLLSGVGLIAVGCSVALLAGFLNRNSIFDTMTASGLLSAVTLGGVLFSVMRPAKQPLPIATSLIGFLCLAFTFHWNPTTSGWIDSLTGQPNDAARWLMTLVGQSLLMALAGMAASGTRSESSEALNVYSIIGWASTGFVSVGCLMAAQLDWAIASWSMAAATLATFLLAWANRFSSVTKQATASSMAIVSTGILMSVILIQFHEQLTIPPASEVGHWIVQTIVWALLATAWTLASRIAGDTQLLKWLLNRSHFRGEALLLGISSAAFMGLACFGFGDSFVSETVAGFGGSRFALFANRWIFVAATFGMLIALGTSAWERAREASMWGAGIVLAWTVAWLAGSIWFEPTQSGATAMRWLAAISCLVTSAIFLAWRGSASTNESEPPRWRGLEKGLVNLHLTLSLGVVVTISTYTILRVMLTDAGGAALGGPAAGSFFGSMAKDISFGVPCGLLTAAFLVFAIAQQRPWLAMIGSMVYQYAVILAIVLLFLSPHPKLATTWFLNILQSVSLGMSVYGLAWFLFRERINGATTSSGNRIQQIEIHAVINGLLVSSLAVLIYSRFFTTPDQVGGWINTAGGPLGLLSLAFVSILIWLVAIDRLGSRQEMLTWFCGWIGLVLVAMLAAVVDKWLQTPWFGLRTIVWGLVALLIVEIGLLVRNRGGLGEEAGAASDEVSPSTIHNRQGVLITLALASLLAIGFAIRGGLGDRGEFWQYESAIAIAVVLITVGGIVSRIATTQVIGLIGIIAGLAALQVVKGNQLPASQPFTFNLFIILICLLGSAWVAAYVGFARRRLTGRKYAILPNLAQFFTLVWICLGSLIEVMVYPSSGSITLLMNLTGGCAIAVVIAYGVLALWDDRIRLQILVKYLLAFALAALAARCCVGFLEGSQIFLAVAVSFGVALVAAGWGVLWSQRESVFDLANWMGIPRLGVLRDGLQKQLPVYTVMVALVVVVSSLNILFTVEERVYRYAAAMIPALLVIGFGCLSDQNRRRWLQIASIAVLTITLVLIGWADLSPLRSSDEIASWLVRVVIVLAMSMFVYGALVSRWVQFGDNWLQTLREMAVVTCGLAIFFLFWLVLAEADQSIRGFGSIMTTAESIGLSVAVLGMSAGLIVIALRPTLDPFSMTENGRTAYVYAAQFTMALLVAHLYFTMPWLFQFGIKDYWPYLAMLLAFAGVGVGQLLQKRQLQVLADPLFNSAAILPVLVSLVIWTVDSKSDHAMVLLMGGLAYLMMSFTRKSIWSGAAALVLGNAALWVFYGRYPSLSLLEHPQLWLIPPAVSVLIAGHLMRNKLTSGQNATLRYLCMSVIYISSTSEIFISGIGDQLWPPIILAVVSLLGIAAGMMFQVQSFLYLGSTFLLVAVLAMVSHAHQRLDHTWPWWAFGIGLGIAILALFGLFEKKRNEMQSIANELRKWER